jgi:hypothetical protein
MSPNSLYPAFVKIDYHSEFGAHTMTLPTLAWNDTPNVGGSGSFENWVAGDADADAMILGLITVLVPFWKADTTFDVYTIYTMDSPEASPTPVASKAIDEPGTSIQTAWSKAVQTTFTFRTSLFGIMKLVMLDAPSGGLFDKFTTFSASPEAEDIRDVFNDEDFGWAGRDGGRVNTLLQIAYTLNEKLRREYNMN